MDVDASTAVLFGHTQSSSARDQPGATGETDAARWTTTVAVVLSGTLASTGGFHGTSKILMGWLMPLTVVAGSELQLAANSESCRDSAA